MAVSYGAVIYFAVDLISLYFKIYSATILLIVHLDTYVLWYTSLQVQVYDQVRALLFKLQKILEFGEYGLRL